MKSKFAILIAATVSLSALGAASAGASVVFSFNLVGDISNSVFVTGTTTGLIFGLNENGLGEVPTGAEIISSPSAVGVTDAFLNYLSGTFDVSSGQIVGVHGTPMIDGVNFVSSGGGLPQLEFNSTFGLNAARGLDFNTGNHGGVQGVTYALVTPLPAALPLFATALGAFGLLGWRKKRKAATALAAV